MTDTTNILVQLSDSLVAQTLAASQATVAIRSSSRWQVSGILWQPDVVVTSEQSLPERGDYEVAVAHQPAVSATVAGRDAGTNVAVLRLSQPLPFRARRATNVEPRVGAIALAVGAGAAGAASVRLGIVSAVGPQWHSRAGGRIERRIVVDARLARAEEGGPVIDADGALLGMSTFGPRGQVLVIPSATLERVVPVLLKDGLIRRGWLGLALHPVAVPDTLREAAGQGSGMMVMSIIEGGAGAEAGVMAGDILLTLDGTSAVGQLRTVLDADSIGRNVDLRLVRGGAITTLRATISPEP